MAEIINLPNNNLVIVDKDLRFIYLYGEIDTPKAIEFIAAFRALDNEDGPIHIIICSEGGGIEDGYVIYDTIMAARNKTITEAYGRLYSMAVMVFQAGDKRLVAPQCEVMIHNVLVALEGDVSTKDISKLNKDLKGANRQYQQLLAKHTKMPLSRVCRLCKKETFFNAAKAIEVGLADELITKYSKRS